MSEILIYLDPDSSLNLQNQIRQKLVDGILSGALPPGGKLPLIERIDELGEGVAEFHPSGKQLESFRQVGIRTMNPRQRGGLLRMVDDEDRIPEVGFDEVLIQLGKDLALPPFLVDLDAIG